MAVDIATSLSSKLKLNDGHTMPWYGIGTYQSDAGGTCEKVVEFALRNNYRLIDTAQYYNNEEAVGRGIANSGIPREEIYVVTKLGRNGYKECKESFMESLRKLGTGYVDLFLIHAPYGGNVLPSYKAMMELQEKGLIRSIGVSNFGIEHLNGLLDNGGPIPAVNQIELHPYCRYEKVVELCLRKGIAVMGYSPLARGAGLNDPLVKEIADKHQKSPAQIFLRWSIQSGYITIPKSNSPERILTNADVFDFSLTEADLFTLNTFPTSFATRNRIDGPWEG